MKTLFYTYKYSLGLTLMWLIAFVLIYPVGEFAINDDWAYTKNVFNLAVNKSFVVDIWPAMNLISQTIYGSIITSIFGFSFTTLRISIYILSYFASLSLFKIVLKLSNKNEFLAFFFTAGFFFSNIILHLSLTFMTEMFFISFLIFAIRAMINYTLSGKLHYYVLFVLFCIIMVLCRQQGLLFAALIVGSVFHIEKRILSKILMSVIPLILCWLASDKYRHYLTAYNVHHNIQQLNDLKVYLKDAPISKHILQASDELLVIGCLLIPFSIILLVNFYREFKKRDYLVLGVLIIGSIILTIKAYGFYPLGNISTIFEIGPKVIKSNPLLIDNNANYDLRVLNYFAAILSISCIMFFLIRRSKEENSFTPNKLSKSIFLGIFFTYFIFVAISNAYFDRYALPLVLILVVALIPSDFNINKTLKIIGLSIILLVFSFTVIENIDYFNWQKERLKAITYIKSKGIKDNEIDGGFEFNGWIKNHNRYPTDNTMSWWWIEKDSFIVAANHIELTQIDSTFIYQRIIPFKKDTIYVLMKKQKINNSAY